MAGILSAIAPVVLILVLGNWMRRRQFVSVEFWAASDKITYYVLFPALLIVKIAHVDLGKIDFIKIALFLLFILFLISLFTYVFVRILKIDANHFSVVYQSLVRFNSYVYFSIVAQFLNNEALALSALIVGFIVPFINVFCVASFSYGKGHFDLLKTVQTILKNPLIIGSVLGFIINLFPFLLPNFLEVTFDALSKAALVLALFSVGASVRIRLLARGGTSYNGRDLWMMTAFRLILLPAIIWLLAVIWFDDVILLQLMVLWVAVPTATSAMALTRQLGGDIDFMAASITLQTIVSGLTLIFWMYLLAHFTGL